jgi:hypothetical protein
VLVLEVYILGWKGSQDGAVILVVDTYMNKHFINRMGIITKDVWWGSWACSRNSSMRCTSGGWRTSSS